jgi:hypothetical protein
LRRAAANAASAQPNQLCSKRLDCGGTPAEVEPTPTPPYFSTAAGGLLLWVINIGSKGEGVRRLEASTAASAAATAGLSAALAESRLANAQGLAAGTAALERCRAALAAARADRARAARGFAKDMRRALPRPAVAEPRLEFRARLSESIRAPPTGSQGGPDIPRPPEGDPTRTLN